jgi:hypothetical protein
MALNYTKWPLKFPFQDPPEYTHIEIFGTKIFQLPRRRGIVVIATAYTKKIPGSNPARL